MEQQQQQQFQPTPAMAPLQESNATLPRGSSGARKSAAQRRMEFFLWVRRKHTATSASAFRGRR